MVLKIYSAVITLLFISMLCVSINMDILALPFVLLGGLLLGIAIGLGCDIEIDIICKKCKKKK